MALQRDSRYPGRFTAANTAHPQGAFKNRSTPTSQDGSYLESDWANDWSGFFEALLTAAGVTPNNTVDTATSSQYFNALTTAMSGRLIAVKSFTSSGTYTPTAGTKKIIVEAFGGGAGGRSYTSSVSYQVGGGGGAGGYFKGLITNVPSSVAVTVGAGGAADGIGGNTLFGSLITAAGGQPGILNATTDGSAALTAGGGGGGTFSFDNTSVTTIMASRGGPGSPGIISGGNGVGGNGGNSFSGGGALGPSTSSNTVGNDGAQYGGGGSGGIKRVSNSDAGSGGVGAKGYVIVYEYS